MGLFEEKDALDMAKYEKRWNEFQADIKVCISQLSS